MFERPTNIIADKQIGGSVNVFWFNSQLVHMLLKGCLHTHTTCSDGKLSPQEVANEYGSRG